MAQPLRGLLVGTLLILVGSAIAIVGIVRDEHVLFVVGVSLLAVIFANEVLAKLWQPPLGVPTGWWRRRPRVVQRDRWLAQQREHRTLIEPVVAAADFRSWKAFYDGDARRRGKEVVLGELVDGEFYWRIIWFPTTEVVAWPFRWRDERLHRAIAASPTFTRPAPAAFGIGAARLPEAIYVVGHAETPEEGKQRFLAAKTLAEIRVALAQPL